MKNGQGIFFLGSHNCWGQNWTQKRVPSWTKQLGFVHLESRKLSEGYQVSVSFVKRANFSICFSSPLRPHAQVLIVSISFVNLRKTNILAVWFTYYLRFLNEKFPLTLEVPPDQCQGCLQTECRRCVTETQNTKSAWTKSFCIKSVSKIPSDFLRYDYGESFRGTAARLEQEVSSFIERERDREFLDLIMVYCSGMPSLLYL